MNSWQIIRASFTGKNRPGSTGELLDILKAIDCFTDLLRGHLLKDEKEATKAFNDDQQVRKALLNRAMLRQLSENVR